MKTLAAVVLALLAVAPPAVAQVPSACASFTDDPLAVGTAVKAVHVTQLRACVNARRAQAGLSAASWTDAPLVPGVTPIRAAHINELRSALAAAFTATGQTPPSYTDPTIVAGVTPIRRVHMAELRAAGVAFELPPLSSRVFGDVDGDGKADVTYFDQGDSAWRTLTALSGFTASSERILAGSEDLIVPGDYDGDGKMDPATWTPSTGLWVWLRSSMNYTPASMTWGLAAHGDIPVPADYDGDGKTDPAVWRVPTPTVEGTWHRLRSGSSYAAFPVIAYGRQGEAVPVPADYDGDGKADIAVWEKWNGLWAWLRSSQSNTQRYVTWGPTDASDIPVPADYDGDGIADPTVWRGSVGSWRILESSSDFTTSDTSTTLGTAALGHRPTPADYDGDGRADIAVFGTAEGAESGWVLQRSTAGPVGSVVWGNGAQGDVPVSLAPRLTLTSAGSGGNGGSGGGDGGTSCTYTVTPISPTVSYEQGTLTLSIDTQNGCEWTALSSGFLTVSSQRTSSGAGDGSVTYDVENNTSSQRQASFDVAGRTVTVTQVAVGTCTFRVSGSISSETSASLSIATAENCPWSFAPPAINGVTSDQAAGVGSAEVTLTITNSVAWSEAVASGSVMTNFDEIVIVHGTGGCYGDGGIYVCPNEFPGGSDAWLCLVFGICPGEANPPGDGDGGDGNGGGNPPAPDPPPTIERKGPPPNTVMRYRFMGNWGNETSCVENALLAWSGANTATGLNVTFEPSSTGAEVWLTKEFINTSTPGKVQMGQDADGFISSATVKFNTYQGILNNCSGYGKVMAHEAGHMMGLADASGHNGSSVMNQFSPGRNDPQNDVATVPTEADRNQAFQAQFFVP